MKAKIVNNELILEDLSLNDVIQLSNSLKTNFKSTQTEKSSALIPGTKTISNSLSDNLSSVEEAILTNKPIKNLSFKTPKKRNTSKTKLCEYAELLGVSGQTIQNYLKAIDPSYNFIKMDRKKVTSVLLKNEYLYRFKDICSKFNCTPQEFKKLLDVNNIAYYRSSISVAESYVLAYNLKKIDFEDKSQKNPVSSEDECQTVKTSPTLSSESLSDTACFDFYEYNKWANTLRQTIRSYRLDIGQILSLVYKNLTKIYGIVWTEEKRDFFKKYNFSPDSTLMVAYYVDLKPTYKGLFKSQLDIVIKEVLESHTKK